MINKNIIVPGDAGIDGEPIVSEEFIINFSGFNFSLDSSLEDQKILVYSSKGLFFCEGNPFGGPYMVEGDDRYFKLDDGVLKKLKADDSAVINEQTIEVDSFNVRKLETDRYQFENKKTGETKYFEEAYCTFITERDKYLYFVVDDHPSKVKRLDFNFDVIDEHVFQGDGLSSNKVKNNYLFYVASDGQRYLEVFNLDTFEIVSDKKNVSGTSLNIHYYEKKYYIFTLDKIFVWDEVKLGFYDIGRPYRSFSIKESFFYLSFVGDPYVYAYDFLNLNFLRKKRLLTDDNYPFSFAISAEYNALTSDYSGQPLRNRVSYAASWHDDDFFKDDKDWDVRLEEPVFIENKIAVGELFSLVLEIDSNHAFEKVTRHGLAAIRDSIEKHCARGFFKSEDKLYSDAFNGNIDIKFINSCNLIDKRKKELTKSIKEFTGTYAFTHVGYANGKPKKLKCSLEFIE